MDSNESWYKTAAQFGIGGVVAFALMFIMRQDFVIPLQQNNRELTKAVSDSVIQQTQQTEAIKTVAEQSRETNARLEKVLTVTTETRDDQRKGVWRKAE